VDAEELAKVYWAVGATHLPVVFIVHGYFITCYAANATPPAGEEFPCTGGRALWPSYTGYGYLAELLASHGMLVVSISANGINALTGEANQRVDLLKRHVALWSQFAAGTSTKYPSMNAFAGAIDMTRVGVIGHSRGGAAVLKYAAESPSGLRAALAIAPTGSGTSPTIHDIPTAAMLGYCDGDVKGLNGFQYFDDQRYATANDTAPKYTVISLGSNHRNFNTQWYPTGAGFPSPDDWGDAADPHCGTVVGNRRISKAEQQSFAASYVSAFFRRHLFEDARFDPVLRGDVIPASMQTMDLHHGYMPSAADRLDINRLTTTSEVTTNDLGGSVGSWNVTANALCGVSSDCAPWAINNDGNRRAHDNLVALPITWTAFSTPHSYSNAIPVFKRDLSGFRTFQFRAAVDQTTSGNPAGAPQNFTVRFYDGGGRYHSFQVSDYTIADEVPLYYPPGDSPAAVMNTIRIPLDDFNSIDKTNISSIEFLFDQTSSGRVIFADIAMAERRATVAETVLVARPY
jgi:dienelactone hydrolase